MFFGFDGILNQAAFERLTYLGVHGCLFEVLKWKLVQTPQKPNLPGPLYYKPPGVFQGRWPALKENS